MAQRLRCPAVALLSATKKVKDVAVTLEKKYQLKATAQKLRKDTNQTTLQPPRECKGSNDQNQGLDGDAESA